MEVLWAIIVFFMAFFIYYHSLIRTMVKWKQEGVLECSMPYCTSPTESGPTPLDQEDMPEGTFTENLLFL